MAIQPTVAEHGGYGGAGRPSLPFGDEAALGFHGKEAQPIGIGLVPACAAGEGHAQGYVVAGHCADGDRHRVPYSSSIMVTGRLIELLPSSCAAAVDRSVVLEEHFLDFYTLQRGELRLQFAASRQIAEHLQED